MVQDLPNAVSLAVIIYSEYFLFGLDDEPRSIFPTIVGRPVNPNQMVGMD